MVHLFSTSQLLQQRPQSSSKATNNALLTLPIPPLQALPHLPHLLNHIIILTGALLDFILLALEPTDITSFLLPRLNQPLRLISRLLPTSILLPTHIYEDLVRQIRPRLAGPLPARPAPSQQSVLTALALAAEQVVDADNGSGRGAREVGVRLGDAGAETGGLVRGVG